MSRIVAAALTAGLMLCADNPAQAQSPAALEWSQVLNLPKGLNMPAGLKADLLGIELGASYREVLPILQALAAESANPSRPREVTKGFNLPVPGSKVRASYVGLVEVVRFLPGTGKTPVSEELRVAFSAPSSGHQVISILRSITYDEPGDQPRLADVIGALKAKFKGTPILVRAIPNDSQRHAFVFNNGAPAMAARCSSMQASFHTNPENARSINPDRACDIVMWIDVALGFTRDHVKSIEFELADNQRGRENLMADFAYLNDYVAGQVNKLREQSGSKPPKL